VILNVAGSSIQRVIQQLILLFVQRLVVATPPAPKPPPPALGVPLPEPYEPLWAWVYQQRPSVLDALRAGIAARHGTRSPALAHDDVDVSRPWGDVTVFILRRDGYEPHPLVVRTFVGEVQADGGSRGPGWVPLLADLTALRQGALSAGAGRARGGPARDVACARPCRPTRGALGRGPLGAATRSGGPAAVVVTDAAVDDERPGLSLLLGERCNPVRLADRPTGRPATPEPPSRRAGRRSPGLSHRRPGFCWCETSMRCFTSPTSRSVAGPASRPAAMRHTTDNSRRHERVLP